MFSVAPGYGGLMSTRVAPWPLTALFLLACAAGPGEGDGSVAEGCGDGTCDSSEQCESCPADCGVCECGDGLCSTDETCASCEMDCGACCTDTGEEPNESEAEAIARDREPPLACDYRDTFGGVLDGADDADWYRVRGSDTRAGGCGHRVSVDVTGARVCIFPRCATTDTPDSVGCRVGVETTSPEGRDGCCATATDAELEVVCTTGSGTLTDFFVRVADADANACVSYRVTYESEPLMP